MKSMQSTGVVVDAMLPQVNKEFSEKRTTRRSLFLYNARGGGDGEKEPLSNRFCCCCCLHANKKGGIESLQRAPKRKR